TNIALKLLRQLTKHGVEPNMVRDYGMTNDDAEIVVTLCALTHCIGMSVHRHGHEDFSLFLAEPKLRELLADAVRARARVDPRAVGRRDRGRADQGRRGAADPDRDRDEQLVRPLPG